MSRGSWLLVTLGCVRELLVDLLLCLVHEEAQGSEHRTCQHAREENQQDQSRASTAALWLGESFVQLARQVFVHFIHGPGSVDEVKRINGTSVQSNQGATSAPEHNKHEHQLTIAWITDTPERCYKVSSTTSKEPGAIT